MAIYTRPLRRDLAGPVPVQVPAHTDFVAAFRRLVTARRLTVLAIVALYASSAAVIARYVDTGAGSWFDAQTKPEYVRAEWLFGPVALGVLALLALSAWLVWRRDWPEPERRRALAVLGVQLIILTAWAPVLFGAHARDLALLISAAMWLACLAALTTVAPANRWAALLATPALVWATYAMGVSAVFAVEA